MERAAGDVAGRNGTAKKVHATAGRRYASAADMDFGATLGTLHFEALLQLGLAIVLGGLVGLEREIRGRAAGLRTMIIVCLGATLIMIVSAELSAPFQSATDRAIIRVDPGRVAAGIVTGVGFLGAGVVLKLGDLVRGVTTAACIWFVAGVGIALGQKHYVLAAAATICCLLVLWWVHYLDRVLPSSVYRTLKITVDSSASTAVWDASQRLLAANGVRFMDVHTRRDVATSVTQITVSLRVRQRFQSVLSVNSICELEGVHSAEWT